MLISIFLFLLLLLLQKVDSDSADDNTVSLLPDIAFDVSWKTLSNLGPWGVSIFCLAGLHFLVMTVAIFFKSASPLQQCPAVHKSGIIQVICSFIGFFDARVSPIHAFSSSLSSKTRHMLNMHLCMHAHEFVLCLVSSFLSRAHMHALYQCNYIVLTTCIMFITCTRLYVPYTEHIFYKLHTLFTLRVAHIGHGYYTHHLHTEKYITDVPC